MSNLPDRRFSVHLLIKHPHARPEAITEALGMAPTRAFARGDDVVTPAGTHVGGQYRHSTWGTVREIAAVDERSIGDEIGRVASMLEDREDFVRSLIDDGGAVSLSVWLFDGSYVGGGIDPAVLSILGRLRVMLGLGQSAGREMTPHYPISSGGE